MNRWNPFYKALAILIAGVLLSFSYSVLLNLLLFAVCMALILAFPQKSRKQLAWIMIPVSIAAVSLFMTGFLHPASGTGTKEAAKDAGTTFSSYNFSAMTAAAGSLYNALQLASRVLGFAGLGLLFAFTTDGEEFILSLMQQGHVKPKFAYGILAAFHLMPDIKREYSAAKLAYRVRGIRLPVFSLKPLFASMVNCIHWSENLAMAMESKGFDGDGGRTAYREIQSGRGDLLRAVILIGGVAAGMALFPF